MNRFHSIHDLLDRMQQHHPDIRQEDIRPCDNMVIWNSGLTISAVLFSQCPHCARVYSDLEIQTDHINLDALHGHLVYAETCCKGTPHHMDLWLAPTINPA